MPISGLILSLSADVRIDDLVAELSEDSQHLEVGRPNGRKLPLVLDTNSPQEDRELWEWIRSRPGVVHVDVSFIHFDDSSESNPKPAASTPAIVEESDPPFIVP